MPGSAFSASSLVFPISVIHSIGAVYCCTITCSMEFHPRVVMTTFLFGSSEAEICKYAPMS
jgi:hypothetical protein